MFSIKGSKIQNMLNPEHTNVNSNVIIIILLFKKLEAYNR
jgi:hypothetical protein